MTKSVDKILARFNRVVKDLQFHADQCHAEMETKTRVIEGLTIQIDELQVEKTRAIDVAKRLGALLES